MENTILNDIKKYAVDKLKNEYGYCGEASNSEMIMLNSDDKNGNDIKITIKLTPE